MIEPVTSRRADGSTCLLFRVFDRNGSWVGTAASLADAKAKEAQANAWLNSLNG